MEDWRLAIEVIGIMIGGFGCAKLKTLYSVIIAMIEAVEEHEKMEKDGKIRSIKHQIYLSSKNHKVSRHLQYMVKDITEPNISTR